MAEATLTALNQASLQDYVDCPRRFQLRYLERLQYPAAETEPLLEYEKHQQQGAYFHRLVQQHLIGIPVEKLSRLANTPDLQRWLQNYLAYDPGIAGAAQYVEFSLSAPLENYRLIAKYDFAAVMPSADGDAGGKVLIFDWKTYRKRPRDEWLAARWQTRIYRALMVKAGSHLYRNKPIQPEQIEMVYWFADYPDDPAHFPYSSPQYKRDWDALVTLAKEIQAASEFPKTEVLQKCSYCPYRSYCNRGVRPGSFDNIESESEADEFFDVNFEQIGEIAF